MQLNTGKPSLPWLLSLVLMASLNSDIIHGSGLTALVGSQVIDGIHGEALEQGVILIDGERIVGITTTVGS